MAITVSVDSVLLRNFSPIFSWSFWGRHVLRKLFHPRVKWIVLGQELTQGGAPVRFAKFAYNSNVTKGLW